MVFPKPDRHIVNILIERLTFMLIFSTGGVSSARGQCCSAFVPRRRQLQHDPGKLMLHYQMSNAQILKCSNVQMPNTKYQMPNTRCFQMPKYQMLSNAICQMPKCQIPNAKYQMPNTKCPNAFKCQLRMPMQVHASYNANANAT